MSADVSSDTVETIMAVNRTLASPLTDTQVKQLIDLVQSHPIHPDQIIGLLQLARSMPSQDS